MVPGTWTQAITKASRHRTRQNVLAGARAAVAGQAAGLPWAQSHRTTAERLLDQQITRLWSVARGMPQGLLEDPQSGWHIKIVPRRGFTAIWVADVPESLEPGMYRDPVVRWYLAGYPYLFSRPVLLNVDPAREDMLATAWDWVRAGGSVPDLSPEEIEGLTSLLLQSVEVGNEMLGFSLL